jgi:hypothetical protein
MVVVSPEENGSLVLISVTGCSNQGHSAVALGQVKEKKHYLIRNGACYLPGCDTVPQQTTLRRAPPQKKRF